MTHKNPTDHPIHPLLAQRWSPYALDASRPVAADDLNALFEAARWSASSYNAQPWRFVVGRQGAEDGVWQKIHEQVLVEGNQAWTAQAPVLALGIIETAFEHNGKPNPVALHDLGAAAASLTLEATARGLVVHQMSGIHPEAARAAFALGPSQQAHTALAIGYPGDGSGLSEDIAARDRGPRQRKPLSELILAGGWAA